MYGERIRKLREEEGLSQAALAAQIGIAQSSLGNYEREDRQPDADTLVKIAKYFHVSVDWLLGLSEKNDEKRPGDKAKSYIDSLEDDLKKFMDYFSQEHTKDLTALLLKMQEFDEKVYLPYSVSTCVCAFGYLEDESKGLGGSVLRDDQKTINKAVKDFEHLVVMRAKIISGGEYVYYKLTDLVNFYRNFMINCYDLKSMRDLKDRGDL